MYLFTTWNLTYLWLIYEWDMKTCIKGKSLFYTSIIVSKNCRCVCVFGLETSAITWGFLLKLLLREEHLEKCIDVSRKSWLPCAPVFRGNGPRGNSTTATLFVACKSTSSTQKCSITESNGNSRLCHWISAISSCSWPPESPGERQSAWGLWCPRSLTSDRCPNCPTSCRRLCPPDVRRQPEIITFYLCHIGDQTVLPWTKRKCSTNLNVYVLFRAGLKEFHPKLLRKLFSSLETDHTLILHVTFVTYQNDLSVVPRVSLYLSDPARS